jgi:hypothetical protein
LTALGAAFKADFLESPHRCRTTGPSAEADVLLTGSVVAVYEAGFSALILTIV